MHPETRQLLAALSAINREIPTVAMRIIDESLSTDKQIEFGNLLIELGAAVRENATRSAVEFDQDAARGRAELPPRYGT